jgi:ATP-dependent Clp protease protease subunit
VTYHDPTYIDIVLAYGLDVRRRRFVLHGDIDHEDEHGKNPITHAVRALLYLDESVGDIEFWISTPGGEIEEMFGLYDVIRSRRNKVRTIGFGRIYSSGVLLLSAGDRRSVMENAYLMSHAGSFSTDERPVPEVKQALDASLRMEERWARLMAQCTNKKDWHWWRRLHQGKMRELWLDADEMLEYGIVDEVIRDSLVE